MSPKPWLPYRLKTLRLPSGEARAFLLDPLGCPDAYSTLYVTVTLRHPSMSVAVQEAALTAINVLYRHCRAHQIDLFDRFKQHRFLDGWEVEALRSSVQRRFGLKERALHKVIALGGGKKGHLYSADAVANDTQRSRLKHIAHYAGWLCGQLNAKRANSVAIEITAMCENILALQPSAARMGDASGKNEFTRAQNEELNSIIEPGSSRNPFSKHLQVRNKVAVNLLRSLGKRSGEVLNIRVGDIDPQLHLIRIVRRADDKDDPRERQPRVKTREHAIPMHDGLEGLISQYLEIRRKVPGARRHPYLLVTHKPGPTRGKPMTFSALNKIFEVLKASSPELRHIHPHLLRHFNSDTMATVQAASGPQTAQTQETHRRTRNYLAGRNPDSPVDALYTQRAIEEQAAEVSRRTQNSTMRLGPSKTSLGKPQ